MEIEHSIHNSFNCWYQNLSSYSIGEESLLKSTICVLVSLPKWKLYKLKIRGIDGSWATYFPSCDHMDTRVNQLIFTYVPL